MGLRHEEGDHERERLCRHMRGGLGGCGKRGGLLGEGGERGGGMEQILLLL